MVNIIEKNFSELSFADLYAMYKFTRKDGEENDDEISLEIASAIRSKLIYKVALVFDHSDD